MNTTDKKKLDLIQRSIQSGQSRLKQAANSQEREDNQRLIRMLEAEEKRLKNGGSQ